LPLPPPLPPPLRVPHVGRPLTDADVEALWLKVAAPPPAYFTRDPLVELAALDPKIQGRYRERER
jgi:hypothetical protein